MNRGRQAPVAFRHLQAFVAACDERHVGRAAVRLHLTQPAVSKTLSELEAIVGHRLLERGRRGTQPTTRGEAFLPHARHVVEALATANAAIQDDSPAQTVVRLGVLPTVAPALVPNAVTRFQPRHPAVGLIVVTRTNADLLNLLRAGDVDLAIGRMSDPAATAGLTFELLHLEGLSFAARPGHPLADGQPVPMARVLDFPLVVCAAGTVPHRNTEVLLGAHGLRLPTNCVETLDMTVASRIVERSDAVWIAPSGAIESFDDLETLNVVVGQQADAEAVGLFRRIDTAMSRETQALVSCIREAVDDMRQRP